MSREIEILNKIKDQIKGQNKPINNKPIGKNPFNFPPGFFEGSSYQLWLEVDSSIFGNKPIDIYCFNIGEFGIGEIADLRHFLPILFAVDRALQSGIFRFIKKSDLSTILLREGKEIEMRLQIGKQGGLRACPQETIYFTAKNIHVRTLCLTDGFGVDQFTMTVKKK